MIEAYCVKCKKKGQKMKDAVMNKTSKGGFMAKGKCPDCGTVMCAMMSADKADKVVKSGEAKKGY